jgi:hypothetical protein
MHTIKPEEPTLLLCQPSVALTPMLDPLQILSAGVRLPMRRRSPTTTMVQDSTIDGNHRVINAAQEPSDMVDEAYWSARTRYRLR